MRACLIVLFIFVSSVSAQTRPAVLLISIDGLRPDYVLQADEHGLKIPHLRKILREGVHASGVRGVLPTVTYPSHTTLLTGVWPVKHHIYSNITFDPLDKNLSGWYWYAEDIASPTLWEVAAKAGMKVGSVSWPVSVRAPGVDYLIPEYWRAPQSADDAKLLRALSTAGLMQEIAKEAGPYVNDLDQAEAGDRQRTRYAAAILRNKRAQFMTVHLAALDHLQHAGGPFSADSLATLEATDAQVGELENAARASFPDVTICVVSDHGFARTDHSLNLMAAFVQAGLVQVDAAGKVQDWKAYPKADGGSAAVLLKDKSDTATRAKVSELLKRLSGDEKNGIARVLGEQEIAAMGGWPAAAFWVDMRTNFSVVSTGELTRAHKVTGTHGYAPDHPELLASFFIAGPKVRRGAADLGQIDMRSVAPTLAECLGVSFPTADAKALGVCAK